MQRVAIILHAHLPWVREQAPWTETERWFHEAMWECYVPLLAWLERSGAPLTVSVSPPLEAVMRDPLLDARLAAHLEALSQLNHALAPSPELREHYAARLELALRFGPWLPRLERLGNVERMTTSATHAFLPGLSPVDGARAQLAVGCALSSPAPPCMWLPECAWTPQVDRALAALDVTATVLDEHGITFSRPKVPGNALTSPRGVTYFGRHRGACLRVWSSQHGYPGHPAYRDFYRDAGFDHEELAPFRRGTMIGLKYHRITHPTIGSELIYEPALAMEQVERDAADFVSQLWDDVGECAVLAFDAELFGHWWHEGLAFLEAAVRGMRGAGMELTTLSALLRDGAPVAEPALSSWGRGGFSGDWVNPSTARWWRAIHRAHRELEDAVRRLGDVGGVRGAALDLAIDATLCAEASDWLYMITRGEHSAYAEERLTSSLATAARMVAVARGARASAGDEQAIAEGSTVTRYADSSVLRACITGR